MLPYADLRGKRALATGACGVIGTWIAQALHAAGAELALTDGRAADLDALAGALPLGPDGFVHTV